ncbi:DUF2332 domain-containing protein [Nocardia sp. NPDC057227]|uniref:DUF2332 domain-containing protein n=1 Tax=Nocardia sp. NPDC057227 TaxID=3346056 RepID=UPI00363A8AE6
MGVGSVLRADVSGRYRVFAEREARGESPRYEALALSVAADPRATALVGALPGDRQQPNLVLAAARLHGADVVAPEDFPAWLAEHWAEVRATALARSTQTNEVGRAAVLLPVLAGFAGPLALLEVGASAGLCLYPDRFGYRYTGGPRLEPADGPSPVRLTCAATGPVPFPARLPQVVHRAGIDLHPLHPADPDDRRWLETLVWPGQTERVERLRAALDIAAADPPRLVAGDLNEHVADLVHDLARDATVVVFHSAVLGYLRPADRERFRRTVTGLPCHWISNEAPAVFPDLAPEAPPRQFVLAVNERPVAFAGPHGQSLRWIQ